MRGSNCPREASCQRERNGEAIGETDDDVANSLGGLEVSFDVGIVGVGRMGYIVHGGSVVQAHDWVIVEAPGLAWKF